MKKIIVGIVTVLMVTINVFAQNLKTSSPLELSKMKNESSFEESLGFSSEELPSSYSFEQFCPAPRTQTGQSCVGWAVAYSATSTTYNLINDITRRNEKFVNVFDPYYVYSSIKSEDVKCIGSGCDCGTYIWEALDLLVDYGVKKLYVTPTLKCSSTLTKNNLRTLIDRTSNYVIDEYIQLIDYKELSNGKYRKTVDIDNLKYALTINLPIISGIGVGDAFGKLGADNSLYRPNFAAEDGGHAITIVGYDDNKYGGSFRIMNSYGSDWGDAGFFWMTYADYEKAVGDAYVMISEDWSSWSKDYYKGSYFKGNFSNDTKKHWEGGINSEDLFNGDGIFVTDGYTGIGKYNNGFKHGWWMYLDNDNAEDPFYGWILFDKGKFIEAEEFGFSSETMETKESIIQGYHLDNISFELNSESADEDTFTIEVLESMKSSSSATKQSFNFNKKNNYNKK
jgi:hypothetical protein